MGLKSTKEKKEKKKKSHPFLDTRAHTTNMGTRVNPGQRLEVVGLEGEPLEVREPVQAFDPLHVVVPQVDVRDLRDGIGEGGASWKKKPQKGNKEGGGWMMTRHVITRPAPPIGLPPDLGRVAVVAVDRGGDVIAVRTVERDLRLGLVVWRRRRRRKVQRRRQHHLPKKLGEKNEGQVHAGQHSHPSLSPSTNPNTQGGQTRHRTVGSGLVSGVTTVYGGGA